MQNISKNNLLIKAKNNVPTQAKSVAKSNSSILNLQEIQKTNDYNYAIAKALAAPVKEPPAKPQKDPVKPKNPPQKTPDKKPAYTPPSRRKLPNSVPAQPRKEPLINPDKKPERKIRPGCFQIADFK